MRKQKKVIDKDKPEKHLKRPKTTQEGKKDNWLLNTNKDFQIIYGPGKAKTILTQHHWNVLSQNME